MNISMKFKTLKYLMKDQKFLHQVFVMISKHTYFQHYNIIEPIVTYRDIIPLSGINTTFEQA